MMFPDWHTSPRIPTVGDDLIIAHRIDLYDKPPTREFEFSVQPKSSTGALGTRAKAIVALLTKTHADTAVFLKQYIQHDTIHPNLDIARVELKNILENYRSALEYTAHYLAAACTPQPSEDKVQFPIARAGEIEADFRQKIAKQYPGLESAKPAVVDYIVSIQEFRGDTWLRQLADLTNINKHRLLSEQEFGDFQSVVIRSELSAIRLGELGFNSVTLKSPGGVVRFFASNGEQIDLVGPCVLNALTKSLQGADPRLGVFPETRKLYCVPGSQTSIASSLWAISKGVFRTVDSICSGLS